MSKFSEQVHISINTFDKNVIYYNLHLEQKMADHHYFSFDWQYTGKTIIEPEDQAKAISRYVGSEVIFTFKVNGMKVMSKGIITKLVSVDLHGSPAGLRVLGISHTVVLDDMKKSRIFLDKSLKDIALEIFAEEGSGEFYQREAVAPTYTKTFSFKPQYNESSFDFMKRLSARYGQWFYFDGMRMQFGQTKASKVVLINGSSLHNFTIEASLFSHKTSFGGYDYKNAGIIRNSAAKAQGGSGDRFAVSMGWNQESIAAQDLSVGAYTNNAQNKEEIDEMVRLQTAGRDANSVFYSGTSYFPIGVGEVFTIQNKTVEHKLVAVEVTHLSNTNGNYSCKFKAIPSDVAAPHYTNVEAFALADSQPAKVIDNNDPEGLGRVKVAYYWNGWGNESDWMRMIQPHSGNGKGFYFIPEIGEEVLVGFEGGNVECPFVIGAQYNGQANSGYSTPNNDLKVLQTRSGNRIISDDATGDITIESQKGQTIAVVHGDGNIRFKAPKNIELEAGEDIILSAGQNMRTNVGLNKTDTIGGDYTEKITGSKYLTIGFNFMLTVVGSMTEWIKGNKETESKDIKERAKEILVNSSEESVTILGAKNVNNHSGETSKNG